MESAMRGGTKSGLSFLVLTSGGSGAPSVTAGLLISRLSELILSKRNLSSIVGTMNMYTL